MVLHPFPFSETAPTSFHLTLTEDQQLTVTFVPQSLLVTIVFHGDIRQLLVTSDWSPAPLAQLSFFIDHAVQLLSLVTVQAAASPFPAGYPLFLQLPSSSLPGITLNPPCCCIWLLFNGACCCCASCFVRPVSVAPSLWLLLTWFSWGVPFFGDKEEQLPSSSSLSDELLLSGRHLSSFDFQLVACLGSTSWLISFDCCWLASWIVFVSKWV